MKYIYSFLIVLLLCTSTDAFSPAQDTSFPTINNNPTINLDIDHSEPEPDNMKPKKKEKATPVKMGQNHSFFSDLIMGLTVILIGFGLWFVSKKWRTKQEV